MKAQISGQVFIYIMAIVIAGLIFLVGFKAISSIINTGKQVNIDKFKSDFISSVKEKSEQFGSREKFDINLPQNFDTVCFVDSLNENLKFDIDPTLIGNNLIRNSVENDAERNVFLLKNDKIEQGFYVENLDVQDDYLCLNRLDSVWLRATGQKALLYVQ